ncbi:MAG: acetate kinase [Bacteroidota bacterium]|nr:acetate kinase [Bacteroidota bacterium]
MKILVLNCGSSSIKYQLLEMNDEPLLLAKGLLERIGLEEGILTHTRPEKDPYEIKIPIADHTIGINLLLDALTDQEHGVIDSLDEINAVGHRVAHGGEFFSESSYINAQAKVYIGECCGLAPLHNPANLKGIEAMEKLLPEVDQVAVFDTSFHQSMPEHAFHYPIPYEYYEKYKLRRYGFHGTSHKFVAQKACDKLDWNINEKKIITCHLGNGASICAIDKGASVDTSMGFTPVEGLMMGTRVGDFDLGGLLHLMEKENLSIAEANNLINKKSGLKGFSGISSDMRDLDEAVEAGNHRADLAKEMFAHRVRKYIGSYAAVMNGLDLIIFTGGIGENDSNTRERVLSHMDFIGVDFDRKANNCRGKDCLLVSTENSRVKAMVVTTNEELVIARDTKRIVSEL